MDKEQDDKKEVVDLKEILAKLKASEKLKILRNLIQKIFSRCAGMQLPS
ncbi:hypothetical protein L3i20_v242210 [Paenibacillus sp. L3-i20]|nr:hypothetical protein L3i20_v242210 [Paenibacillus sp. L3-i20]